MSVALIDKSEFPRDKICGDALSPDVVNQLNMLPLETGSMFDKFEEKIWCKAVRFVSPNFSHADVSLNQRNITGYVSPRIDFDQFMFSQAIKSESVTPILGSGIKTIQKHSDGLVIELANGESIKADVVLGADGANSAVGPNFIGGQNGQESPLRRITDNTTKVLLDFQKTMRLNCTSTRTCCLDISGSFLFLEIERMWASEC